MIEVNTVPIDDRGSTCPEITLKDEAYNIVDAPFPRFSWRRCSGEFLRKIRVWEGLHTYLSVIQFPKAFAMIRAASSMHSHFCPLYLA